MPVSLRPHDLPEIPHHPIPVDQVVIEILGDPAHPGGRLILQDGVESSYIDIASPQRLGFEYQRHLASVIDVLHPKRRPLDLLQIGGGPCAVVRYLDATRKDLRASVVEIDAGVIAVAEQYLGLRQSSRLTITIDDGRHAVGSQPAASLDVVIVDAFTGLVVPHHLVTAESTSVIRTALRAGGIHIINLIDIPPHGFAQGVVATLAAAYDNVALLADSRVHQGSSAGNFVVVATDADIPVEVIARRARHDASPWDVLSGKTLTRWVNGAGPLHDDVAPTHDLALMGQLFGRSRRRSDPS